MPEQIFPEPTVGILIFNPRGELLLVKTYKWHGKYAVPGGHIELGESALEAARREAKEETGLDVMDINFLVWQECIYDESFWKPRHFIFLDFIANANDQPVVLNDEAEAFIWIDPEKAVREVQVDSYTAFSIHEYLQRRIP
jgi:nucleoside triphosphatase